MKKLFTSLFILGLCLNIQAQITKIKHTDDGTQTITLKIKGLKDTMVYLANYYGDKTYYADSAIINSKGVAVFKPKNYLGCGVYIAAVNGVKLFEFIIKENNFTIESDTQDYFSTRKAINSMENTKFFEYQDISGSIGEKNFYISKEIEGLKEDAPKNANKLALLEAEMKSNNDRLSNYLDSFINVSQDYVIGKILKGMREPNVPDFPRDEKGNILDSNFQYQYYKTHYWDNIDFSNDCILRTPIYHKRLEKFFEKVTIMYPDSLIKAADQLMKLCKNVPELYKYNTIWIASKYERSEIMCMDAVFVHMALNYYTYDKAFWMDSADILRVRDRAETLKPIMCNVVAPNIQMFDTTLQKKVEKIVSTDSNEITRGQKLYELLQKNKTTDLHDVKAKYTLLVFWDPDCGHCQKELPKIQKTYNELKDYGFQVYAVGVEQDFQKWLKYISDNKHQWISVTDPYNISKFRSYYDISSTPVLFLLDENFKIIAKKISADQLEKLLVEDLKIQEKSKK